MADAPELLRQFLADLGGCAPTSADVIERLQKLVADGLAQVRSTWPGLTVSDRELVGRAAGALAATPPGTEVIDVLNNGYFWADLAVAVGCTMHDPVALDVLERCFLPGIEPLLVRGAQPSRGADDLRQIVRQHLLVGAGDRPPAIARYGGRGALRSWLKVVVARILIDLGRSHVAPVHLVSDKGLAEQPAAGSSPESAYAKLADRQEVKAAFAAAIAALTVRQRNLLRQQLLHGLTLEELAALYHVHRATVARHLAEARKALVEATHQQLMERLGQSRGEVESLLRDVMASEIDLSIQGALQARSNPA